jgi:putative protease
VQASRPVRVIFNLTGKTAKYLLSEGKAPLPFKPADIILALDPYFPQADAEQLTGVIAALVEIGYHQFMVNNLGHFSLLREFRSELLVIAGPWLYTFNAWALSFILSLGVDGIVSPLENNRQNLERTLSQTNQQSLRSMIFVPVFAWPPLFHIRADLGKVYDFKSFNDSREENFSLVCDHANSIVIPEKPFSITDKIPFLKEAGLRHLIIDLSGQQLRKRDYKDLMRAVDTCTPLPRISRFNWKDGFFISEQTTDNK